MRYTMTTWNPDMDLISKIEAMLGASGSLGEYFPPAFESGPIQGFYDGLLRENQEGFNDIAHYLKENFDLTKPIGDKFYTCEDVIQQMKDGTALGVISYVILGAFAGCYSP